MSAPPPMTPFECAPALPSTDAEAAPLAASNCLCPALWAHTHTPPHSPRQAAAAGDWSLPLPRCTPAAAPPRWSPIGPANSPSEGTPSLSCPPRQLPSYGIHLHTPSVTLRRKRTKMMVVHQVSGEDCSLLITSTTMDTNFDHRLVALTHNTLPLRLEWLHCFREGQSATATATTFLILLLRQNGIFQCKGNIIFFSCFSFSSFLPVKSISLDAHQRHQIQDARQEDSTGMHCLLCLL